MKRRLNSLLKGFDCEVYGNSSIDVSGVFDDSRKVVSGGVFVAISGLTVDGHEFIDSAIEKGAVVVIGEKKPKKKWLESVTYVKVDDSREALAVLALNWYGNPSRKLKMIGVTGTDGKTTTASIIAHILNRAGKKTGVITTVTTQGLHTTTPEPMELHKLLRDMVDEGCKYCVLEVTSIGIDQRRVWGIDFDVGVLTNITHEHMYYHKTMGEYIKVKAWLLGNCRLAVINREYYDKVKKHLTKKAAVKFFDEQEDFNKTNKEAAALVARQLGVKDKVIKKALKDFKLPTGRVEEVKNRRGIGVYIDFAHTPNALESVFKVLKKKSKGRLVCVFGCASERDDEKRPMMGEVAVKNADVSVFTAEDPRHESVDKIIGEIEVGAKRAGGKIKRNYFIEHDRGKAIWMTINKLAKKGDTVVVCGKGHEKSMNYRGVEYPWSDFDSVSEALRGARKSAAYLRDKKAAVLGLGVEGKDLARFLVSRGALVTIFDQKNKNELDLEDIDVKRVRFVTGEKYLSGDFGQYDVIYRSPGVYRYKKELVRAEKSGVEISSALKLFMDLCPARVIGVTGTKGKGTTSTLIYEILKADGRDAYLVGNIGVPYLGILDKLNANSWVVMELSSFQLIDLTKSPHIGVVLNITKDHLDWHKALTEYIDAKKNIVRYQDGEDFAVINKDYKVSRSFGKDAGGDVVYFSGRDILKIFDPNKFKLRGEHNWENIAAAASACKAVGISEKVIKRAVYAFGGLEHRLEFVVKHGGVSFYNDSFSTNPEPAIAAVKSFSEPITIILGGYDKGLDYGNLGLVISKKENVKNVVLIGDTADKIKKALLKAKYKGSLVELGKAGMREIVNVAFENTPKGGVVILSPASASFDMFADYKERGKKFKEEVKRLVRNGKK